MYERSLHLPDPAAGSTEPSRARPTHRLLIDLPDCLETDRLILRGYRAGDGPAYLEVAERNREHLARFEADNPIRRVRSVEDAEILVREFAADWFSRRAFFFGSWLKAGGAFAAQIYVGSVDWEVPELEIGYFVDREHQGRGLVAEAVRACLGFVFDHLGANRVSLRCSDLNPRSFRLAERCGFQREGHLRECDPRFRADDGALGGKLEYGMLRSDFDRLRSEQGIGKQL